MTDIICFIKQNIGSRRGEVSINITFELQKVATRTVNSPVGYRQFGDILSLRLATIYGSS